MYDRKLFKCYDARFLAFSLVAGLVVIGAAFVGKRFEVGSAPRVFFALIQVAALAAVIIGSIVAIRRLDELQQRVQYQSLAIAFAVTGVLISAQGVLEKAGLPAVRWGLWAWPVMVVCWVVALWFVQRRYR
jgi:uncharacterized membrane protein